MKKLGFLFCALCLMAHSGSPAAEERQGADTVIAKKDGQAVKGELIAVKADSLLLLGDPTGAEMFVSLTDISTITVKTRPGGSHVLIVGSAIGLGALAGGIIAHKVPFNDHPGTGVAIGAAAGLGLGLTVDLLIKTRQTFRIEGLSSDALRTVLDKLRSKARVPDAR